MKFLKFVGKFIAIIYCIVYFFVLSALLVGSFSLSFLSGNYYSSILKTIDFKKAKLADFGDLFIDAPINQNVSIEDAIVVYFKEGGIEEELTKELINNETVKDLAGKYIGEIISFSVGGDRPEISKKDIELLLSQSVVIKIIEKSPEKLQYTVDNLYNKLNELIDNVSKNIENNGGGKYDNSKSNTEVNPIY